MIIDSVIIVFSLTEIGTMPKEITFKEKSTNIGNKKATLMYEDTYMENMPDGLTAEHVKKLVGYNKRFIDAAVEESVKNAEEIYLNHESVEEVNHTYPFEINGEIRTSISRSEDGETEMMVVVSSKGYEGSKEHHKSLLKDLEKAIAE